MQSSLGQSLTPVLGAAENLVGVSEDVCPQPTFLLLC